MTQGLGNVGSNASKFLTQDDGMKLVALAEYNGGIYNEEGISLTMLKNSLTRMVRLKIILKLHLLKILAITKKRM